MSIMVKQPMIGSFIPIGVGVTGEWIAKIDKSAQAAQARHQRARNSPLLPGRSESVVRDSSEAPHPGDRDQKWRNLSRACDAVRS